MRRTSESLYRPVLKLTTEEQATFLRRAFRKLSDNDQQEIGRQASLLEGKLKASGGRNIGPQTVHEILSKLGLFIIASRTQKSPDLRRKRTWTEIESNLAEDDPHDFLPRGM